MSSLLKCRNMNLQQEDKRIIDTNALVSKRIEEIMARMQEENAGGFMAGLQAEEVEALTAIGEDSLPGDMQGQIPSDEALLSQAREQADQILGEADKEVKRIIAEAEQEALATKKQMAADAKSAREKAYAEGKQAAQQELQKEMARLKEKERALEAEYKTFMEEAETKLVDVISGIYEHVFNVELSAQKDIVFNLIQSTLSRIEGGRSILVHVSKEDFPYVSMQKKQITASVTSPDCSVEVVEDFTLTANQCLIETENGIYDCSLGTQLEELRQKLLLLSYEKK